MKAEWGLSDKQLGALVSVVSVTVALGALPVALFADRGQPRQEHRRDGHACGAWRRSPACSRAATASCSRRASLVGLGEAGYGSVGAALIASHFPARMRGALLAGFFASRLGRLGARRDARRPDRRALGLEGGVRRGRRSRAGAGAAVPEGARLPHGRADAGAGPGDRARTGERRAPHRPRAGALAHHAVGLPRRRRAADRGLGASGRGCRAS